MLLDFSTLACPPPTQLLIALSTSAMKKRLLEERIRI
jgi:hypothetical protein